MREIAERKKYAVLLRCPHRDEDTWVVLPDRTETLDQILSMSFDFVCSIHGVQREIPIAANEQGPPPAVQRVLRHQQEKKARTPGKDLRAGPRIYMRIPVRVYGWVSSKGAFHEETNTIIVNPGGCLVQLYTRVELGDMLFVVNKTSSQELQCRVAYTEPEGIDGARIGLAFKSPQALFWKSDRVRARVPAQIQVTVRGKDRRGEPYVQSAYTIDISEKGARLQGLEGVANSGEIIEVKRGWHKAKYRVVWIGPPGTPAANQVGLMCMEDGKNIWGSALPVDKRK